MLPGAINTLDYLIQTCNEKGQESKDSEKDDSVIKHTLWSYLARDDYLLKVG